MAGDKSKVKFVRGGGCADALRVYKIFINDELVGTLDRNAVLNREVPSGQLKIEARIDWAKSQPLIVDVAPEQTIEIEVSNRWNPMLAVWGATFGSQNYFTLKKRGSA
jgi:hypothetical protein